MQQISTENMSREEWLATRKNYIGGSDAAAILGMNPYKSPLAVYADKLGLVPDQETNERMRQGNDLEEYVAQRFVEQTGFEVRTHKQIMIHNEYPFIAANIDRMLVFQPAGLEAKTTSLMNKTDFENGDIPPTFHWQCQHYIAVTGFDCWYLAVLILSKAFHVFKIDRNEEHIKLLIDAESDFWNNHVLKKIPPLPTGSESDNETISSMFTDTTDETADLTVYGADLDFLQILERDIKMLTTKADEIKQRIKLAVGECESGMASKYKVTYKKQTRAAYFAKASTSRVLRIKEIKQ